MKKILHIFCDFSLTKFDFRLTFEGDSFTLPLLEIIHLLVNINVSKYEGETVPPPMIENTKFIWY